MPDIISARRRLAARYGELLADLEHVIVPHEPQTLRSNWQSYSIGLAEHLDQRTVMQHLLDRGVASRRGIMCAHREVPYLDANRPPLPISEHAQDHVIVLPLFPQMTDDELQYVADSLRAATTVL